MPAEAVQTNILSRLEIPSINLSTDAIKLEKNGGNLRTPDNLVGSYSEFQNKVFLVGHVSGVFSNLDDLIIGDEIIYSDIKYAVTSIEVTEKTEINMDLLLLPEENPTIVLMTCADEMLSDGDATHRLIITAEAK